MPSRVRAGDAARPAIYGERIISEIKNEVKNDLLTYTEPERASERAVRKRRARDSRSFSKVCSLSRGRYIILPRRTRPCAPDRRNKCDTFSTAAFGSALSLRRERVRLVSRA